MLTPDLDSKPKLWKHDMIPNGHIALKFWRQWSLSERRPNRAIRPSIQCGGRSPGTPESPENSDAQAAPQAAEVSIPQGGRGAATSHLEAP